MESNTDDDQDCQHDDKGRDFYIYIKVKEFLKMLYIL